MRLPALLTAALLCSCASLSERQTGERDGHLQACGSAPRCVSSTESRPARFVEPMVLVDSHEETWAAVGNQLSQMKRTTIVEQTPTYIHAEIISPWHFYTDDLELLRHEDGLCEVRSSARIGYYDFNVNRKRVEALRDLLQSADLLGSPPRRPAP